MATEDEQLMEEVEQEVEGLDEATLAEEAGKILEKRAKQAEYRKNQEKSPEQVAKQQEYRKRKYARDKAVMARYNELNPEQD